MVSSSPTLRKTPLNAWHRAHGGRLVEFAGWEMPASYGDSREEHLAVRTRAGLFDLSDTGVVEVAGTDALAAIQWMTSNDAGRLQVGQVQHPPSRRRTAPSSTTCWSTGSRRATSS